jgi:hypothetical protein
VGEGVAHELVGLDREALFASDQFFQPGMMQRMGSYHER